MLQKETIRNLTEIQLGYQFRSKPKGDEQGSVKLIQIKDILPNRSGISPKEALRFEPERDTTKQILQEGDVLFMGKGSAPFACTVSGLAGPTVAGGMFFILRPDTQRVLPDYLAWCLSRKETLRTLTIASGTGVAMPVIRRSELEQFSIPLPPLEIQQRIGELQRLSREEKNLMNELIAQKEILMRAVCNKLASEF